MNKIKIGLIGVGNMGKRHARVYSEISDVDLVSLVDTDEETIKELSQKYEKSKVYSDYHEMLEKEKLDAVSICVPTSLHYSVAKECIKNGLHVLLEKPITSTVSEGQELLKLASSKKVKFLVGHIERFNPAVKKTKEMIENGDLGNVIAISIKRVGGFPFKITDSNIVVDSAIHDIDIVNYLLGRLPVNVYIHKQKNIIKMEDSCELFLDYGVCSAYIQANWITPIKIRKLSITGTKGYLELDYISQGLVFYKSNVSDIKDGNSFSEYRSLSEPHEKIIPLALKEPLKEEIKYFLDCIKNDKNIDSDFAVQALKIALT